MKKGTLRIFNIIIHVYELVKLQVETRKRKQDMAFKRKIELGCVLDSEKKLCADVLRQNITKAGEPEASRQLLDLCAPLPPWARPVKNKTKPGQSTTQLKLA